MAVPLIQLTLSHSPLLSTSPGQFSPSFLSHITYPLPTLSFAPSTSKSQATRVSATSNKPLPSVPPSKALPPKEILALLALLERMDNDVAKEVQRIQIRIQEAFTMIDDYYDHEKERVARFHERRSREAKETKGLDHEFWLNV